jgi:glycosyltransferase involved in cell wall biosynthesis
MIRSVSILIATHNRDELLAQTFESLAKLRIPPGQHVDLIVVANGCTDSTISVCEAMLPKLPMEARFVEESQLGLSIARNRAVMESTGEVCAFLDDDVCVAPEWYEGMVEVYNAYPADIVGGPVALWWVAVERPEWFNASLESLLGDLNWGDEVIELFHPKKRIIGANFSFKREVFDRIGPFRSDLGRVGRGMMATEETEFCERALRQGARMYYAPRMALKHWVAPQRATVDFLVKAARGSTAGRMRAKNPFGVRQFSRSFFGNSYLVVRYELGRWWAKLRGDRRAEVTCHVLRESSAAGVAECLRRALSIR